MKSSVLPQIRVEPALRVELEQALRAGETLSGFIESAVRNAVSFRQAQARFQARGQTAWENYVAGGHTVPADQVVDRLQAKLDARRRQLNL